jgi:aromatic amino acid aminotransferase I / 2-aminoadipate transaminase
VLSLCRYTDIIIVEDDPYFFLQYPGYDLTAETFEYRKLANAEYLASLVPSFLRFDYQGRVIRLESFSKTLAPGLRVGYFICNAQLSERLLRATEVDTQEPSGLSQAVILGMLDRWQLDGYVGWLQNLALEYQRRRDWMLGALRASFDIAPASAYPELQAEGLVAAIPGPDGVKVPVFSFIPPTAGMFIWCKTYFAQNPTYQALQKAGTEEDPEQAFADKLWLEWTEANVCCIS